VTVSPKPWANGNRADRPHSYHTLKTRKEVLYLQLLPRGMHGIQKGLLALLFCLIAVLVVAAVAATGLGLAP
jgi:hypothetical protein